MRRWRAFPPNLETKGQQNKTVSGTKRQKKGEAERDRKKDACVRERKEDPEALAE